MLARSLSPALSLVLLVLGPFATADQWQDSTGYPSASGWQAGYPSSSYGAPSPSYGAPAYSPGPTGCAPGFNDVLPDLGGMKHNFIATGASAALAAILAKLPALVFVKVGELCWGKVLIFKLVVVPLLFMMVAIPVLAPLLMMLMPMMMSMMGMMGMGGMGTTTTTTTAKPMRRSSGRSLVGEGEGVAEIDGVAEIEEVLRSLLGSHRCLERVACNLGVKDSGSTYRKPITWLLKQLQALVPAVYRDQVKVYRQAYMTGAAQGTCSLQDYPCQTPELLVRQDQRTYRLL